MSAGLRRFLAPLTALAVSGALSLLAAEGVVRLLRPQPRLVISPGGFYQVDPPGRYRLSPGYRGRIYNRAEYDSRIRINEAGLRGEELTVGAADRLRVLTLGDSFVFGVGVEDSETFTALLPEALAGPAEGAEGLNAGIPAFGVPDAVSWLSRHGLDLDPDVVILAIFQGNDLVDASPDQEEILLVDGLLVPGRSSGGLKAWLHRHSHLYVLVKGLLEQPGFAPLRAKLGLGEPWKVRVLREEYGVYRRTAAADMRPAVAATDRALAEIAKLAEENGFVLMAVLIPSEIQIDPLRWQAGLESLGLPIGEYDPEVPTRIFSDLLESHRIPTLDLGPLMAERLASGEDLYYRLDRHWTTRGHALAAQKIATFLNRLLVERKSSPDAEAPREHED